MIVAAPYRPPILWSVADDHHGIMQAQCVSLCYYVKALLHNQCMQYMT